MRLLLCIFFLNTLLSTPVWSKTSATGRQFQDWAIICQIEQNSNANQCYIFTNKETKSGFVRIALFKTQNASGITIVFRLPPNAVPHNTLDIVFSDRTTETVTINHCEPDFCQAAISNNIEPLLEKMIKASSGTLSYTTNQQQNASLTFSLRGFSASYKKLLSLIK